MTRLLPAVVLLLSVPPSVHGQGRTPPPLTDEQRQLKEFIAGGYTKYEHRVPMRDGVRLHTAVYVPKDAAGLGKKYPILLLRTPYSCAPYGVDQYPNTLGPSPLFARAGYVVAYQDVRGCWMSEGTFENMRPVNPNKSAKDTDETTDTYDTIDWLVKHAPGNNGKVGQWGISYPGFYTAAGMIDAHPALKASSPQAPVTDWFVGDDFHHNGALFLPHCFNFMANFGRPRPEPRTKWPFLPFDHGSPDGYDFFLRMGPVANADTKFFRGNIAFWTEAMRHGTYDDFWKARNLRPHIKNVKPAVLTVGGWFDAENLFGALEVYKRVKADSPDGPENTLVMGPWVHGGWSRGDGDALGAVQFRSKTSKAYQEAIEFPFFEHHLKGAGTWSPPAAWVFETGTNQWRKYDAWPPKQSKPLTLRFGDGGTLAESPSRAAGFDEFVSDPAKPVPYMDKVTIGMDKEYMVADQRFAARRPDVLVYQTDVLTEDTTVSGPVEVELHVTTTGTDADWVVKLIDVYPPDHPDPDPNPREFRMGGYQQLIRGDIFRGKFRTGFDRPEPFEPGKPAVVKFTMPDTCHCFRPGHRLMVQVQSSWFPLADRNPQTFCDIYTATDKDFRKATHRVLRSADKPSAVTLRVVR